MQSTTDIPPAYRSSFSLADFHVNIIHQGSLRQTLSELATYEPVAVIAGGESGVELADALSEGLGLATNGTLLSSARRDKYTMIETIRAAGLRAPTQLRVTSEPELRAWHERLGGKVVLKPPRSAGSDGVHFCDTPDEAAVAYHKLLGRMNVFAERNDSVVAQEYLAGTEYILNTVSRDGRLHVCDIWQSVRADVNGVLDLLAAFYIIPREGPVQEKLVSYAEDVLNALGIRHGPAHIEIRMTPDGPCLVEVGARIGGADSPYYAELATGESQLDWTVDAYTNPSRFDQRYAEHYTIHQHFASVVMLSPHQGVLRSYPFLSEVERLESLHDIRKLVREGDQIAVSVDDLTSPMSVNLLHPVEGIVMRDMATLRYLDGPSFYEVV